MKEENIRELLKINTLEDISSIEIDTPYMDDHLLCVEMNINGIEMEFLWRDTLGFLDYFRVCNEAFIDLRINILVMLRDQVKELFEDPSNTNLKELEQLKSEIETKLEELCTD